MTVIINGTSGITDVNGTAAAPAITGTDTDTGVFFGTNTVSLSTGGTERLQVDSSGNLGLGVTPSAWGSGFKAIDVNTYGAVASSTSALRLFANSYNDGTNWTYKTTAAASRYDLSGGAHAWLIAASGTAGNAITFTQAMTLDASGNLGIGLSSLGYGANARLTLYRTSMPELVFADDLTPSAAAAPRIAGGTAYMTFSTNGSERARIDSSGNLLVGTTSGSRPLCVATSDNRANLYLNSSRSSVGSEEVARIEFTASAPNNTTSWFIYANDTAAQRFSVRSNGGIANFSANNVNLSDRREKTNFAPAGEYLSKICAIPVQTFNYIDQNMEDDPGTTLGVVAQDVQAVAPELVMESNWGTPEEPKMRLSIYQTDLQYALMKSIQELKAIVDAQAAEIAALKGQA